MQTLAGTTTATTKPNKRASSNRMSDYEIADAWVSSVAGELYFSTTCDHPATGEFYIYLPEKTGKRYRIRYLHEMSVHARILNFLSDLRDDGVNVHISPNKIKIIRTLGALMMQNEREGK